MNNFSYDPRPIRFLNIWTFQNWRLKVYTIAYQRESPQPELINAARIVAEERLAQVSPSSSHYHVGFVGIHEGKTANFVFVDWWSNENELHHHVYMSPLDRPTEFEYVTPTGLTACVWDLRVMSHERDAWIETVLNNAGGPDFGAYLQHQLNEKV